MNRSALLLPALLASTLTSCATGPTAAEVLELKRAEMSQALQMPVGSLDELDPYIKVLTRRNIAGHSALSESDLWNLELYSAGLRGSAGEYLPATVLRIPHRDSAGGGGLYLGFDAQGMLVHNGTSNSRLNSSRDQIWSSFLSQFIGRTAAQTGELMTPGSAHLMFASAGPDVQSHYAIARALAEHRSRVRRHLAEVDSGQIPSAQDLRASAQAVAEWQLWLPEIEGSLGSGNVRSLLGYAAKAEQILLQGAQAAASQQVAELRLLLDGDLRREQLALETVRSQRRFEVEGTTAQTQYTRFGVPILDRVDKDVWSPPGKENEAQTLASMVHAGLLLAGHLQSEARL